MRSNPCQETTFGYLSVLETAGSGFFGGYLIINPLGRPLEFHCTAPIRPSRAQEILYGPTLRPYLLSEQIGRTLLEKSDAKPKLILTDQPDVLYLRCHSDIPVVQLLEGTMPDDTARSWPLLGARWALPGGFDTDWPLVEEWLTTLSRHVDLGEPFGRIHEAIREALRIGTPGDEVHGSAA